MLIGDLRLASEASLMDAIYWTIVSIDTKVWEETRRKPLSNLNGPLQIESRKR
jgi:hypothetical protein